MDRKKLILETLKMQPLSEEEKTSRHILGRLYGPIATSLESTRNGRKYNAELWERALDDEIFKEKVASKSLFLELGHPMDREETDMEKVCACIPEMPKIVDGDLYAYVDILDTNNGRVLKTLCDYGFVPGISSRGSGDIMANDEVDPETFFLETWDIVQLPAVKKARLAMCESYNNGKSLKTALTESYEAASTDEKKEIKEILENLDLAIDFPEPTEEVEATASKLEEETEIKEETVCNETKELTIDDIPLGAEDPEEAKVLMEETDDEEQIEEPIEETTTEEVPEEAIEEEPAETDPTTEVKTEIPVEEVVETVEEVAEEIKEVVEATEEQSEAIDEVVEEKVEEILPEESSEETVEETESEDIEVEQPVEETPEETIEAESNEESVEEVEEKSEEAEDVGLDEWISNLKEMIRQKDLLEAEIKHLKEEEAVSDAEVENLKEELNKYKTGFARVSELASKATAFEKEVQSLSEQLTHKKSEITDLQSKIVNTTKLTESVNAHETKAKSLTEKLDAMQKDLTATETKLVEQKKQYKGKLTEAIDIAKSYKSKCEKVINHYIESKASMLGVRITDITSKLHENYSVEDIDAVCEELLEAPQHFSNSLFSEIKNGAKVKFNESAAPKKATNSGYEIDDDLLELAGLK